MYNAIMDFVRDNPTYDVVFFTDSDAYIFMCETQDPVVNVAYQTLQHGAARADVWRLAVIIRYGGVYFDIDCGSKVALDSFVSANASVVSGVGKDKDFHQWALLYTAAHPFLRAALDAVVHNVLLTALEQKGVRTVDLTGPPVFNKALCAVASSFGCGCIRELTNCREPLIGIVQVLEGDHLNENIVFKSGDALKGLQQSGYVHYRFADKNASSMFASFSNVQCAGVSDATAEGQEDQVHLLGTKLSELQIGTTPSTAELTLENFILSITKNESAT